MTSSTVSLTLPLQEPPLWDLERVTHIGSLDPAHKGCRGESYEGTGLSVSVHPEEWEEIARLGGQAWWETDLSALRILDGHQFIHEHSKALEQWGQQQGWLRAGVMYKISWFDEEMQQTLSMLLSSLEDAQNELEEMGEGTDRIETIDPCWLATPKLDVAMGRTPRDQPSGDSQVLQDVATVWAKEQGLDGVWWEDNLEVEAYSAPRGVVFEDRVPRLTFEKVREPRRRPSLRG